MSIENFLRDIFALHVSILDTGYFNETVFSQPVIEIFSTATRSLITHHRFPFLSSDCVCVNGKTLSHVATNFFFALVLLRWARGKMQGSV